MKITPYKNLGRDEKWTIVQYNIDSFSCMGEDGMGHDPHQAIFFNTEREAYNAAKDYYVGRGYMSEEKFNDEINVRICITSSLTQLFDESIKFNKRRVAESFKDGIFICDCCGEPIKFDEVAFEGINRDGKQVSICIDCENKEYSKICNIEESSRKMKESKSKCWDDYYKKLNKLASSLENSTEVKDALKKLDAIHDKLGSFKKAKGSDLEAINDLLNVLENTDYDFYSEVVDMEEYFGLFDDDNDDDTTTFRESVSKTNDLLDKVNNGEINEFDAIETAFMIGHSFNGQGERMPEEDEIIDIIENYAEDTISLRMALDLAYDRGFEAISQASEYC